MEQALRQVVRAQDALCVLVDVQDALAAVMSARADTVGAARLLVRAAGVSASP